MVDKKDWGASGGEGGRKGGDDEGKAGLGSGVMNGGADCGSVSG